MDTSKLQHGFDKAKEFANDMKNKMPGYGQKKTDEPLNRNKVDDDIQGTGTVNKDADVDDKDDIEKDQEVA